MSTLYCVNIRWVKSPVKPEAIDQQLSPCGDWIRFDGWSWLLESDHSAQAIANRLKAVLSQDDGILVIKCDPYDYGGWAQPWVWEWINSKRPAPGTLPPLELSQNAFAQSNTLLKR